MKAVTEGIWVWTKKAEEFARDNGMEERTEGYPASCGYELLKKFAPRVWVEKGYVEERLFSDEYVWLKFGISKDTLFKSLSSMKTAESQYGIRYYLLRGGL